MANEIQSTRICTKSTACAILGTNRRSFDRSLAKGLFRHALSTRGDKFKVDALGEIRGKPVTPEELVQIAIGLAAEARRRYQRQRQLIEDRAIRKLRLVA